MRTRKELNNLNDFEYRVFEVIYNKRRKRVSTCLLIFLLFGVFGGHRFYVGDRKAGLILLLNTILSFGTLSFIAILDVINIKRLVYEYNDKIVLQCVKDVKKLRV